MNLLVNDLKFTFVILKELKNLNKKIQYIAYICFVFAALALSVAIIRLINGGQINLVIIGIIVSVLWYQAGAGLLKRGNKSRKLALVLFVLYSMTFLFSSYYIVIKPLANDVYTDSTSTFTRWAILILGIISLYCAYVLMNKKTKSIFDPNKNDQIR